MHRCMSHSSGPDIHCRVVCSCGPPRQDEARLADLSGALAVVQDTHAALQEEHRRFERCYTPRPGWDDILGRLPELKRVADVSTMLSGDKANIGASGGVLTRFPFVFPS